MMKKTNADLIRSMSNEELAQYLHSTSLQPSPGVEALLEWLNRPFERKGLPIADEYRIRLYVWVLENRQLFTNVQVDGCCYGKRDASCVYIVNLAFQSFCESHGYDSLDVLRTLFESGFILTRKGTFHGGHYRTSRVCREPKSCVWLVIDDIFAELEECVCENT